MAKVVSWVEVYGKGYEDALKAFGKWLIEDGDELRDKDTNEIDYYGVKLSEVKALMKGELPK